MRFMCFHSTDNPCVYFAEGDNLPCKYCIMGFCKSVVAQANAMKRELKKLGLN